MGSWAGNEPPGGHHSKGLEVGNEEPTHMEEPVV